MTTPDHVADGLLIRAIDDELTGSESMILESHLSHCEECKQRYQQLRAASIRFESAVAGFVPSHSDAERRLLASKLEQRDPVSTPTTSGKIVRQFGWGMALAATLAIAVLLIAQSRHRSDISQVAGRQIHINSVFEIDGERFVALPYSNPELPMPGPHIVQMQVPVSSLAAAGIVFEPISNRAVSPERSVLADVLLGIDGQPMGVHVLGAE
jgi:anti-sigma factor RsiW